MDSTALDFSFYSMTILKETLDCDPRHIAMQKKNDKEQVKNKASKCKCFKLNNNCLSDITDLKAVADGLFEDSESIAWIDLSFNELTKIDDMLYLHGNQISDLKEIEKLTQLKNLKKLSLHGNPVENTKGYRYSVIAMFPNLQVLDFSRITKADTRTADTLSKMAGSKKPKKKAEDEDA